MTAERRAFPRVSAGVVAQVEMAGAVQELPVRDISLGGIFVYGLNAPVGEVVGLAIGMTDKEPIIHVKGEIVRLSAAPESEGGGVLGAGLQFEDLTAEQREALDTLLGEVFNSASGERRAYPRLANRIDMKSASGAVHRPLLRELSRVGLAVWVDAEFAVGESVALEIGSDRVPSLKLTGKVVSSERALAEGGYHKVALKFDDLPPSALSELDAFLSAITTR